jgi:excisionase family DNA binding protein
MVERVRRARCAGNAREKFELLTPAELADELRVSKETVYRLVNSGRLEALRLGDNGSIRIRRSALEKLRTTDEGDDER